MICMDKKKKRLIIRTIILLIMIAAIGYTLYGNFMKDKREKVVIGDIAPDFVLTDMDGNQHKLSDYRGKGVFLNFWGTWCKPCEKEMPYMNNQYHEFADEDVVMLAVNVGEAEFLINKFIDKHGLDFPVLRDKNRNIMGMYDVGFLPATYMITPEGKIQSIEVGELTEEKINRMLKSVLPK